MCLMRARLVLLKNVPAHNGASIAMTKSVVVVAHISSRAYLQCYYYY